MKLHPTGVIPNEGNNRLLFSSTAERNGKKFIKVGYI